MVIFWIHCILLANHERREWRGNVILPGQFISSIANLSAKTKLSPKQVRGCISKLKTTGEMASQSTNEFTLFTLNSWEKYQVEETEGKPTGKRRANEGQAEGKRRATNKNDKNEKNEEEVVALALPLEQSSNLPVQRRTIEERASAFAESLRPFAEKYPRELLLSFYNYWSEPTIDRKRLRFEKAVTFEVSRRLQTWAANESNFSNSRRASSKSFKQQERETAAANQAEIEAFLRASGVQNAE